MCVVFFNKALVPNTTPNYTEENYVLDQKNWLQRSLKPEPGGTNMSCWGEK